MITTPWLLLRFFLFYAAVKLDQSSPEDVGHIGKGNETAGNAELHSSTPKEQQQLVSKDVKKICIIGGGVAGICASRVLASRGFNDLTLIEEGDNLSGVWAKGYPNFAIQTPGILYEFPDKELPEPSDFKDGPSIAKYCEEYLAEHNLTKIVKLNTKVTSITATLDNKWKVTTNRGKAKVYDFVVLATGVYSPNIKFIPKIEGMDQYFNGKVYHSVETAKINPERRKGKKVIVVGYGKSSHDCAMNALQETGVAPTLLFRSAHWCVPRKIFGLVSFENFLYSRFGQGLVPGWSFQQYGVFELFFQTFLCPLIWLYWRLVELILILQLGLYGRVGAKLRPTMSIEKDMYCGHGLICHPDMFSLMRRKEIVPVKGSMKKILPSGKIQLNDGSELDAPDEIVFATGYERDFRFLPRELVAKKEDDGFFTYRHMFVPGVPNIAFLNSNIITFSNIATPAIQAAWLAEVLQGNVKLPDNVADVVENEKKWRRKRLKYTGKDTRSYFVQLHTIRYWDSLLRDMGAEIKRKRSWGNFLNVLQNFFQPAYPSDYESIVTGEWKDDPRQVHRPGYKSSFLWEWSILGLLLIGSAYAQSISDLQLIVALCILAHWVGEVFRSFF